MAKWVNVLMFLVVFLATHHATARVLPSEVYNDEKNVVSFGGVGGYSGLGPNGIPFGGVGSGIGAGGDIGGTTGFGGVGGGIGTLPSGGLGGLGGGGGGLGGGIGGGDGGGVGGGTGVLPYP